MGNISDNFMIFLDTSESPINLNQSPINSNQSPIDRNITTILSIITISRSRKIRHTHPIQMFRLFQDRNISFFRRDEIANVHRGENRPKSRPKEDQRLRTGSDSIHIHIDILAIVATDSQIHRMVGIEPSYNLS